MAAQAPDRTGFYSDCGSVSSRFYGSDGQGGRLRAIQVWDSPAPLSRSIKRRMPAPFVRPLRLISVAEGGWY